MFLTNFWQEGVFKREFRKQLVASLSVTLISLCHGIALGWLAPMLVKLQSPAETPLSFAVNVTEASWIGALISVGGVTGNFLYGFILERFGRKKAIYLLALPHVLSWAFVFFSNSVALLYTARICVGTTGGGCFLVIPIFVGEIADATIRGRLTSLFTFSINIGILIGFIIASHLSYYLIPCIGIVLPLLYLLLATRYPETPQYLLRHDNDEQAENSLKFYRNYEPTSKEEIQRFNAYYDDLKAAVEKQKTHTNDVAIRDFINKRSLKAICTGIVLVGVNMFSGSFAILNYMSTIFAAAKAELHPNTNTIIIGAVQIVAIYTSSVLVDRFGRKILMMTSTAGMGISLAAFGMYAFFAEETNADLSQFSSWLPLLLMACIIFSANIGIMSVTYVVLVEIMPPKIRARAVSLCFALLSVFSFAMLKIVPIFMELFGLSATMWLCASVCALGLFYLSIFLEETKGKSMDKD